MGIKLFGRISASDRSSSQQVPTTYVAGEPQPHRFKIRNIYLNHSGFALYEVKYPDCKNFEGIKLILTKEGEITDEDIIKKAMNFKTFDPHFFEDNKIIARFRPDEWGFELAHGILGSMGFYQAKPYKIVL